MKDLIIGLGAGLALYSWKLESDYKKGKTQQWTTERVLVTVGLVACVAVAFTYDAVVGSGFGI